MKNENTGNEKVRSIQDRSYDLLSDMLIERDVCSFMKDLKEEEENGNVSETEAFFAQQDRLNMERIQRYCKKEQTRHFFNHTLPRIGQIAAVIIAVISVSCGVGFATSKTIRVTIMRLLLNVEKQYTEVKLVEDETRSFDVPAEWHGECYPSYLPDGLDVANVVSSFDENIIDFRDIHTGNIALTFIESGSSAESNIDTENAQTSTRIINGYQCHIVKKDASISVFWTDGMRFYLLTCDGINEDEAISITEGVRRIE